MSLTPGHHFGVSHAATMASIQELAKCKPKMKVKLKRAAGRTGHPAPKATLSDAQEKQILNAEIQKLLLQAQQARSAAAVATAPLTTADFTLAPYDPTGGIGESEQDVSSFTEWRSHDE